LSKAGIDLHSPPDQGGNFRGHHSPPQQCPHPGHHALHLKGLRHIVVGPGIEARNDVLIPRFGRQDENGGGGAPASQVPTEAEAIQMGQVQVQNNQVIVPIQGQR